MTTVRPTLFVFANPSHSKNVCEKEQAFPAPRMSHYAPISESDFPDMPCMKRLYRDKKASFHWSAAKNKECFSSR